MHFDKLEASIVLLYETASLLSNEIFIGIKVISTDVLSIVIHDIIEFDFVSK